MNYLSIYGKKNQASPTVGSAPMTQLVQQLREVKLDVPAIAAPTPPVDDQTQTIQITNCRILRDGKLVSEDSLWVQNGKIVDPRPFFWEAKKPPHKLVDGRGLIVIPGYIDVQLNGGFGVDFSSDTDKIVEGLEKVSKGLPQYGCTAYCPTIVSSHADIYEKVLPHLKPRKGSKEAGAEIIGAHLEGPFIAMAKRGAHNPAAVTAAPNGISDIEKRYGAAFPRDPQTPEDGIVKIVTLAPELDGMMDKDVIKELSRRNINVSIGHTTAGIEEATNAVNCGATLITHLFNAMAPFHHRDPGVIGLLGASNLEKRPYYGIICDGIHTHPNSAMVAYYAHPKGAVLVTDAMGAMGLPYGKYKLGQMDVERTDHGVYITGTDTLAGSDATMDACVQNFRKFTNCSFVDAVEAATLRPAEVMGIKHFKGTLNAGSDADFLFVDDDLNLYETWIAGERVWSKEESPVQVRSNLTATLNRFKQLGKSAPYDDTDDL